MVVAAALLGKPVHPCTAALGGPTVVVAIEECLRLARLVEDLKHFHVGMIGGDVGALLEGESIDAVGGIEHTVNQYAVNGEIWFHLVVADVEHLSLHLCRIVEAVVGFQFEVGAFGLLRELLNGFCLGISLRLVLCYETLQEGIDIVGCLSHRFL